ncbi:TlpA disulfide reductase family protein [Sphingomonas sp.]|uniref:TlpA family protein disulfide reductase n=1 Tax=Sphingomonas sp. TaxID=28214 RepID=UPI0025E807FA|nr:TlpA disulfide reductase family protein [Sphingomonas sp.]MBV9527723.1 TlpA family protein disulfide reductase [Sphingomonas sp.]
MRFLLFAMVFVALADCSKPASQPQPATNASGPAAAAQAENGKGVDRSHRGSPAPDAEFVNGEGEKTSLSEIADGKPLLVNLWASWCAPCVKELPTLDSVSQAANGRVRVAAVSQDAGPHASVEAFLTTHRIVNLEAYQDSGMELSGAIGAQVLPTSVLYDAKGREVWRYVGDLDWTSPEAAKLLSEAGS